MANPWQYHNGPDISKGPGDGAAEEGGEGAAVEAEEEGRGRTQGDEAEDPPPAEEPTDTRRAMRTQELE